MSMIHGNMNQAVSRELECPAGPDIYRHLSVANIGHLLDAYGAAFAESVMRAVQHRLRHLEIPDMAGMWVDLHQAGLYLRVALHPGSGIDENLFDEMLAVTVSSEPVVVDGRAVLVDIAVNRFATTCDDEHALAALSGDGQPALVTRFLQQVYRQDMTVALALHRAIKQKNFELWARPILAANNTATLYQECLIGLRKRKDGKSVEAPADRVAPALPQNISSRHIDRFIVRKTIELLRRYPSVQLGCHISAQSAVDDTWWSSTFRLLAMAPSLAVRLVIEITDTASVDIGAARPFCGRLQSLGCRIAVDGFNDGDRSLAFALTIKPDIVKVAMPVIHAAQAAPQSQLARHLAHFLNGGVACVVAAGVQAECDGETLRLAGIPWVLGCCIGPFDANGNAHFPQVAGFHALLGRLARIEQAGFAGCKPYEALDEYVRDAQAIVESPQLGLSAGEANAVMACYADTLYRTLCGLSKPLGQAKPCKYPGKVRLEEPIRQAIEAVAARQGAIMRSRWQKKAGH